MDIDNTGEQTTAGNIAYMDNPRHDEIRRIVQPFFNPSRVRDEEHPIRQAVRDLVGEWDFSEDIDLAQRLAWPLPIHVFFKFMGIETTPESVAQLEVWSHALKDRVIGTPELSEASKEATLRIREFLGDEVMQRAQNPRDDLLTHIVQAEISGKPFLDDRLDETSEIIGLLFLLFLGGFESTAGLIGTMFKLLAENPDQLDLLRDDGGLSAQAVEETVRWATPLQETARTCVKSINLHGVDIPEGSRIVLITGSANRDERQFENPDKFDLSRGKFRHVGFGEGLHRCLGAPLARLEARIVLEELVPKIKELSLSKPPTFYPSSPNMYVWQNLPVRFVGA
jgi:cytochrome P450